MMRGAVFGKVAFGKVAFGAGAGFADAVGLGAGLTGGLITGCGARFTTGRGFDTFDPPPRALATAAETASVTAAPAATAPSAKEAAPSVAMIF